MWGSHGLAPTYHIDHVRHVAGFFATYQLASYGDDDHSWSRIKRRYSDGNDDQINYVNDDHSWLRIKRLVLRMFADDQSWWSKSTQDPTNNA